MRSKLTKEQTDLLMVEMLDGLTVKGIQWDNNLHHDLPYGALYVDGKLVLSDHNNRYALFDGEHQIGLGPMKVHEILMGIARERGVGCYLMFRDWDTPGLPRTTWYGDLMTVPIIHQRGIWIQHAHLTTDPYKYFDASGVVHAV